jgi:hypothetical protein
MSRQRNPQGRTLTRDGLDFIRAQNQLRYDRLQGGNNQADDADLADVLLLSMVEFLSKHENDNAVAQVSRVEAVIRDLAKLRPILAQLPGVDPWDERFVKFSRK